MVPSRTDVRLAPSYFLTVCGIHYFHGARVACAAGGGVVTFIVVSLRFGEFGPRCKAVSFRSVRRSTGGNNAQAEGGDNPMS